VRDWYGFHATIAPITTADEFHTAFADPETRWYAQRRLKALAASGALVAAPLWNPNLHPRGHDGKFIQKFGWVRWFDQSDKSWRNGWVKDISPTDGKLTIRSGGETLSFPNAKNLYAKPKPKASLQLPNLIGNDTPPKGWKKVGGQGGSNPGGMFQIEGDVAPNTVDLTRRSGLHRMMSQMAAAEVGHLSGIQGADDVPETSMIPSTENIVIVPRLDGTQGKYDVLQRFGSNWYRTPSTGPVTEDDLMRPSLQVSPTEAFGAPNSARRQAVLNDPASLVAARDTDFDVEDVARLVQATGSPLPEVGDKFYVKTMPTSDRANNEVLANDLYELLGVPVPEVALGTDGKTVSSKLIGEKVKFDPSNPTHVKTAQDAFIADAWLANWDSVGQSYDNMQVDPDGRVWRVDAGGALVYRAMVSSGPKGAMFGDKVGELDSLRNPSINPQAAKVFGSITSAQMSEQAERLAAIKPAQIKSLVAANGMDDGLADKLIARRKDILFQLNVPEESIDVTPKPAPKPTPSVYNPVEAVQQMGSPPSAAIDNWNAQWQPQNEGTILTGDEWLAPGFLLNAVFFKAGSNDGEYDGDLWVYDGGDLEETSSGAKRFRARNLFNDQTRTLTIYDEMDGVLDMPKDDPELDQLMADLQPARDLAIAEFVERNKGADLSAWNLNEPEDPNFLSYAKIGMPSFLHLMEAKDSGRLSDEHNVIWNGQTDGQLYVVEKWPTSPGEAVIVRMAETNKPIELNSFEWKASGPWFMPGSDGAAALWKSRANDLAPGQNVDTAQAVTAKAKIDAKTAGKDDHLVDLAPDPVDLPSPTAGFGDDEPVIDYADAPADVAAVQAATVDEMFAGGAPTSEQKTVHNVALSLSPSATPLLTSDLSLADKDMLEATLVGKSVVVLPADAYDNPDWSQQYTGYTGYGNNTPVMAGLQTNNGLATVVSVEPWGGTGDAKITVLYGNGKQAKIRTGSGASYPKMIVPVETAPVTFVPTLKQDGSIMVNGTKVGYYVKPHNQSPFSETFSQYYYYNAVVDADHSITGKATVLTSSKQSDLKLGITSLVNPHTALPKPVKPKSKKALETEQKIHDLNEAMELVQSKIKLTEEALANVADAKPVGTPLNDGSMPQKGDWVYSTKDGVYAQVKQLDPKLGPKHTGLESNYIKVAIPVTQTDGSVKWKWTNRPKDTLVAASAPGEPPVALATKAKAASNGDMYGPGMMVETYLGPTIVMDTTIDGKVKVKDIDGVQHWLDGSQVQMVTPGEPTLTVKTVPKTGAEADALNKQLATLTADSEMIGAAIAAATEAWVKAAPKAKKPKVVGTPYPGANGFTVSQPKHFAADRTAAGLNNLKDGYAPTVGLVLRHNDGSQWVVIEVGDAYSSHKNSVRVRQVGAGDTGWPTIKWRAISTMAVDHEAMSTDANGDALPVISALEGSDWLPNGQLVRRKYVATYVWKNPATGKNEYRNKESWKHYVVAETGEVYSLKGDKFSQYSMQSIFGNGQHERIGYIQKDAPGGQHMSLSVQNHQGSGSEVEYVVIHDPGEVPTPATPSGPAGTPIPTPGLNPESPMDQAYADPNSVLNQALKNQATTAPVAPTTPVVPDLPHVDTPTTPDLPVFAGKNPVGAEMPHPPTTSSKAAVPTPVVVGGTPTLDHVEVGKAQSVMEAVGKSVDQVAYNKANKERGWVSQYGLADRDVIEDMLVQSSIVKDAKGDEYVEVEFRLSREARTKVHSQFVTSSTNQAGDWDHLNRNAKNLVAGDLIAVRVSGGGGATVSGGLRPDSEPGNYKTPNAQVVAPPVLIGKNKAGTYDVWRTQVVTAHGETGFIDLEDRNGTDSVAVAVWDPTKPRTSNGSKDLNPNAKNDGWSVKTQGLEWQRTKSGQTDERDDVGIKPLGTGYNTESVGAGWTMQRDYNGAHVELQTSSQRNSNNGRVVIRVKADDPDAQAKVAMAMESVGVSKAAQAPPDAAALKNLAANKVYEQFAATWSPNMKLNDPDQALAAIDAAVGKELGRKATWADVSIRTRPDGRVQVLVSEDVSRAIVKRNGVSHYQHLFTADNVPLFLEQVLSGETPGLMATTERWKNGMFYKGKSSTADHGHDSADHMFLTMKKGGGSFSGSRHLFVDPVAVHRQVDYYWQPGDSFGDRQSDNLNFLKPGSPGGGNELMLKRRFEPDMWGRVTLDSATKANLISKLHKRGITHAPNGMLLEDFLVTGTTSLPKELPSFGDEVPIASLPTVPSAPAIV
jgi:hypothetical protein